MARILTFSIYGTTHTPVTHIELIKIKINDLINKKHFILTFYFQMRNTKLEMRSKGDD